MVAFSIELLEWGGTFSGFVGKKVLESRDLKIGKITSINRKWLSWDRENFICPKVTKIGSIIGHKKD